MAPSTDTVVADAREKRLAIDRRIDTLRQRVGRYNPKRVAWNAWSARALPYVASAVAAWAWRRYRYSHRFMRLP
jgi:hypothetical protein